MAQQSDCAHIGVHPIVKPVRVTVAIVAVRNRKLYCLLVGRAHLDFPLLLEFPSTDVRPSEVPLRDGTPAFGSAVRALHEQLGLAVEGHGRFLRCVGDDGPGHYLIYGQVPEWVEYPFQQPTDVAQLLPLEKGRLPKGDDVVQQFSQWSCWASLDELWRRLAYQGEEKFFGQWRLSPTRLVPVIRALAQTIFLNEYEMATLLPQISGCPCDHDYKHSKEVVPAIAQVAVVSYIGEKALVLVRTAEKRDEGRCLVFPAVGVQGDKERAEKPPLAAAVRALREQGLDVDLLGRKERRLRYFAALPHEDIPGLMGGNGEPVVVAHVMSGGHAASSGIKPGHEIIAIEGLENFRERSAQDLLASLQLPVNLTFAGPTLRCLGEASKTLQDPTAALQFAGAFSFFCPFEVPFEDGLGLPRRRADAKTSADTMRLPLSAASLPRGVEVFDPWSCWVPVSLLFQCQAKCPLGDVFVGDWRLPSETITLLDMLAKGPMRLEHMEALSEMRRMERIQNLAQPVMPFAQVGVLDVHQAAEQGDVVIPRQCCLAQGPLRLVETPLCTSLEPQLEGLADPLGLVANDGVPREVCRRCFDRRQRLASLAATGAAPVDPQTEFHPCGWCRSFNDLQSQQPLEQLCSCEDMYHRRCARALFIQHAESTIWEICAARLQDGDDLLNARTTTLEEVKTYVLATRECEGFCFEGTDADPAGKITVSLKRIWNPDESDGFIAYRKIPHHFRDMTAYREAWRNLECPRCLTPYQGPFAVELAQLAIKRSTELAIQSGTDATGGSLKERAAAELRLAVRLLRCGDRGIEAEKAAKTALGLAEKAWNPSHPRLSPFLAALAEALWGNGKKDGDGGAMATVRRAMHIEQVGMWCGYVLAPNGDITKISSALGNEGVNVY